MMKYEEIRNGLIGLCERENLKFFETDLEDECIIYLRFDDKIVFNSGEKELITV